MTVFSAVSLRSPVELLAASVDIVVLLPDWRRNATTAHRDAGKVAGETSLVDTCRPW